MLIQCRGGINADEFAIAQHHDPIADPLHFLEFV